MLLTKLLEGITWEGEAPECEIVGLTADSRQLEPGWVYVCQKGQRFDGHDFAAKALELGAAAVVVDRDLGLPRQIRVEDTHAAYPLLCANFFGRPADSMKMIGVTGTNGKTTSVFLIKHLLTAAGHRTGLIGTVQNEIGDLVLPAKFTTPDPYQLQSMLAKMRAAGCEYVAMEVSSHALDQHRADGIHFDVAVFTNRTLDHLDYHHTMEEYRDAKGLLFRQCAAAVLNLDDEAGRWYAGRISGPVFTYSENRAQADLTARNIRLFPGHVEFEAVTLGHIARVHLPIPGGFSIYNALAALSAGLCLELPLERLAPALRSVHGVKGRVEVVPVPRAYTVLIDYAHSPNALENILLTARDFTAGRLICLFGCGGDRDKTKRPIMGAIARELADLVVLTSDNPRTEEPEAIIRDIQAGMAEGEAPVHVEPDRRRAIAWVLDQGQPGDVIVLAGKGHETYQEINGVQFPMDEREIVASWFRARDGRKDRAGNLPAAVV